MNKIAFIAAAVMLSMPLAQAAEQKLNYDEVMEVVGSMEEGCGEDGTLEIVAADVAEYDGQLYVELKSEEAPLDPIVIGPLKERLTAKQMAVMVGLPMCAPTW